MSPFTFMKLIFENTKDKDELIAKLTKAVGDHGKVSPIEWSMIGKRLGVFDAR